MTAAATVAEAAPGWPHVVGRCAAGCGTEVTPGQCFCPACDHLLGVHVATHHQPTGYLRTLLAEATP